MTSHDSILAPTVDTTRTLESLGIENPVQVLQLFGKLRSQFDRELFAADQSRDAQTIRAFFQLWNERAHDILGKWIGPASPLLKREVRKQLDRFEVLLGASEKVRKDLRAHGVERPEQISGLFDYLRKAFDADIEADVDSTDLEITRVNWLGRKLGILGKVTDYWVKPAPPDLKRAVGQALNEFKVHVEATVEARRKAVEEAADQAADARERFDLSLPGVHRPIGTRHILRQTIAEIERIFLSIGFSVVEGPEIETPYYNFEALNIPANHPARDMMDTLYIEPQPGVPDLLLRTHTSPMQIRTMEKQPPPVRIIVPGKVYRRDNPDATHSYVFHQVEGLAVDTDITFCDFKGTMEYFMREFFGPTVRTRLQPSFFPFTEPSADVYGSCFACDGRGCPLCKYSGWIELLGAGMVDPAVYGFVNYDAKKLSGFAFGVGVERLAMLKYGINDIQLFFQSDARFLRQFS